jgi:hypothetical protein
MNGAPNFDTQILFSPNSLWAEATLDVTVFAVKVPNIPAADYFAPLSRSSSNFNE